MVESNITKLIKELPIDVVRIINSYGYIGHKIYMKELCKQINITKNFRYNCHILFKDHVKHNQTPHYYTTPIPEYDTLALLEHVKIKLLKQANRCFCCNRHCNKRPNLSNINESDEINESYYEAFYESNCGCYCRHIARSMKYALTNHITNTNTNSNNNHDFHSRLNILFKEYI